MSKMMTQLYCRACSGGPLDFISTDTTIGGWRCLFCQNWFCFWCGVRHFHTDHKSECTSAREVAVAEMSLMPPMKKLGRRGDLDAEAPALNQAEELLFLCSKCEEHYSIKEPTAECPVCGWRSLRLPADSIRNQSKETP